MREPRDVHAMKYQLSGAEPAFTEAYSKAVDAIKQAIIEFESATGRQVDSLDLDKLDVTTLGEAAQRLVRQVQLGVLPIHSEMAWA